MHGTDFNTTDNWHANCFPMTKHFLHALNSIVIRQRKSFEIAIRSHLNQLGRGSSTIGIHRVSMQFNTHKKINWAF
ncbi:MAG: hypothetical protein D3907_00865 [Candidatus Electrothrix sp. AUS3]|nr:hypothetical protein [Candidatus Electrothrix gigas]